MPLLALALALPAAAQKTATTPALDALASGAAKPDCAMNGVTGEACTSTDAPSVASSTSTAKPGVTMSAITHREDSVVPSPSPIKKKAGSIIKGIKDYFGSDTVKAGMGFGAAIGMLLLAASPVGLISAAVIGAAVGAIICGGLIQKIFHHFLK